ncbi:uncharacterized protein N7443_002884 [Penicillium atrosanguineum]|uniref:uncharacterized protein n=1 Tax=Penicillium atrosanguineum TaxID=1132637 RepID=UPI0023A5EDF9|nr:uncharacterized protein N7443_002884 [Penicillium atrosanguineum]KAJ5310423.1 hypothetical protein N7443_002884 [Penicillium atrosanguineum]
MLSKLLLILAVAVVMVSSQWSATIDPSSVSLPLRKTWCSYQQNSCPLICLQVNGSSGASVNTCDANSLDYSCICSNGISPNASEYSETMAYFICTEAGNQPTPPVRPLAVTTTRVELKTLSVSTRQLLPPPPLLHPLPPAAPPIPLGTDVATGGAVRMSLELGQVYGLCAFVGAFVAGFAVLL